MKMYCTNLLVILACLLLQCFDSKAQFQWAKNGGSVNYDDEAKAITVDSQGNVYTIGSFSSIAKFDPLIASATLSASGPQDIFISKYDINGQFIWVKKIGGINSETGTSIATDSVGNVYASGFFTGIIDVDPGIGVVNTTVSSGSFLIKLDLSGNFVWVREFSAFITSIKISFDQSIYIGGEFYGTNDFNPGTGSFNLTAIGTDAFISKLNSAGNFVWAVHFGDSGSDRIIKLDTDLSGNVFSTGVFSGITDFDPGTGVYNLNDTVSGHVFISKIDINGFFAWAHAFDVNEVQSICTDLNGNVVLSGYFSTPFDADPGVGTSLLSIAGVYLIKLNASGNFSWGKRLEGYKSAIACDQLGNILLTATYNGVHDFDPGPNICILETNLWSIYLLKLSSLGNFIYAKQFIQSQSFSFEEPNDIEIDQQNNIYTCGKFEGNIDFDPTNSVDTLTSYGKYDMYAFKISACNPSYYSFNAIGCDTYFLNGQYLITQGTYSQMLTGSSGCDSLLTIFLTIHHINDTVTLTGTTLTSNATGVSYQWIRCPVNTIIPGATNQSYTPISNGLYAVILTDIACVDTSLCLSVTGIISSISDPTFQQTLQLTPNPTHGDFSIQSDEALEDACIKVFDLTGQLILNQQHLKGSFFQYDLSTQADGIYFISITNQGKQAYFKLVKE